MIDCNLDDMGGPCEEGGDGLIPARAAAPVAGEASRFRSTRAIRLDHDHFRRIACHAAIAGNDDGNGLSHRVNAFPGETVHGKCLKPVEQGVDG